MLNKYTIWPSIKCLEESDKCSNAFCGRPDFPQNWVMVQSDMLSYTCRPMVEFVIATFLIFHN